MEILRKTEKAKYSRKIHNKEHYETINPPKINSTVHTITNKECG